MVENVKAETITKFIKKFVKTEDTELYTDQYRAYNDVGEIAKNHETLNRSAKWEAGELHTNTIEGFWSLVKRAVWFTPPLFNRIHTPLSRRGML